jgi:hypothetical protein
VCRVYVAWRCRVLSITLKALDITLKALNMALKALNITLKALNTPLSTMWRGIIQSMIGRQRSPNPMTIRVAKASPAVCRDAAAARQHWRP